jgi:hypothetical protein
MEIPPLFTVNAIGSEVGVGGTGVKVEVGWAGVSEETGRGAMAVLAGVGWRPHAASRAARITKIESVFCRNAI